jgi:hypothetical protein
MGQTEMSMAEKRIVEYLLVAVLFGTLLWLVVPTDRTTRDVLRTPQCRHKLKQIGVALWSYREKYGTFPPAYIAGPDGKRLHSWRVLLLPFMDYAGIYADYRFDEPWDGPNNRRLRDRLDSLDNIYRCPDDPAWPDFSRRAASGRGSPEP